MAYNPYSYPNDPEASTSYYSPASLKNMPSPNFTPRGMNSQPQISTPFKPNPTASPKMGGADIAGAATGALGLASNIYGMTQQRFNFGNIASSQTDPNSAPTYTAGEVNNQVAGAKPKGAGAGEILSGAGQGAKIGMSFGPIGAAIGAVGGALFSGIGGAIRKNKQDTEKNRKMDEVRVAQGNYNKQSEDYRLHQNQLYDYYNQNNAQGREYNVLRSRMTT